MAYKAEPKNPRSKRSPLWSPETLKDDLRRGAATLTSICKRYAEDETKWRALYNDVQRWKSEDPELEELLEENRKKTDPKKRKEVKGGRPRKDKDDPDFRVRFCQELLHTKSRNEASKVTPYTPEEIYQMLTPSYTSYDEKFSEMVHFTEMRLVAWAEEEMWLSLEDAQHPKDRAWIAKEILKVRDRNRWGDKLDVTMTATHTHVLQEGSKVFAQLEAERREAFQLIEEKQALEAGEIVEAEVVSE